MSLANSTQKTESHNFLETSKEEPRKLVEIGDVPSDIEHAFLDAFVVELQRELHSKGYIIVYDGPKVRKISRGFLSPQLRAERAKEYMTEDREFDNSRVIILVGGRRSDQRAMELWIVPLGADPPIASPSPKSRARKRKP
jgi:hypothetical protein